LFYKKSPESILFSGVMHDLHVIGLLLKRCVKFLSLMRTRFWQNWIPIFAGIP